ncbi:MAG TPA: dipeptide epimerase [Flavobacterium sp.]|jgi:L-alanine-DL-glutamate epimerase-like enolase superfamily enzyme
MAPKLAFQFYDLPLRHPFTISRYTVNVQRTVIVTISDGIICGYGEATVNPYYNTTEEKLAQSLNKIKPVIERLPELDPKEFWTQVEPQLLNDYFALCAVDVAYWDYFARIKKMPLRCFWSNLNTYTPLTSYTIGIDSIELMKQKIFDMPWPKYKIKLGTDSDLKIIESLRAVTDSVFRIDANGAWNADQTISYSKILKEMNVEFIEQPLKADDFEGMAKVSAECVLPVIADESCQRESDVEACVELFSGINIKLMKCGGITPALRMIEKAKLSGLLTMAGCMTESTIGISAMVQIAPLLDYIDSDGALLLSDDIADGVSFEAGRISYVEDYGTGAELRPAD